MGCKIVNAAVGETNLKRPWFNDGSPGIKGLSALSKHVSYAESHFPNPSLPTDQRTDVEGNLLDLLVWVMLYALRSPKKVGVCRT